MKTVQSPSNPNMTFSGPIPSRNANEAFIRVDEIGAADDFGFTNRKTGFLSVVPEKVDTALEALATGKREARLGSQNTRSGAYNVSLIDPAVGQAQAVAAEGQTLVTHNA